MKYQYKLNGEILFETNDSFEFIDYLILDSEGKKARNSVLRGLLEKSEGYVCNMISGDKLPQILD